MWNDLFQQQTSPSTFWLQSFDQTFILNDYHNVLPIKSHETKAATRTSRNPALQGSAALQRSSLQVQTVAVPSTRHWLDPCIQHARSRTTGNKTIFKNLEFSYYGWLPFTLLGFFNIFFLCFPHLATLLFSNIIATEASVYTIQYPGFEPATTQLRVLCLYH